MSTFSYLNKTTFCKEKKRAKNETKQINKELFDSHFITFQFVLIMCDFTLFSSWFLFYHKLSLRKASV